MITIYTDGSSRGNPGPGGWGVILIYDKNNDKGLMTNDEWVTEIGGRESHTTNNRMELTAAIKALEFVSKLKARSKKLEAVIYTDSEYVIKGMTEWIKRWQIKGWKTAGKKPVLNQDLWQRLLELTDGKEEIEWRYVAGHSGITLNERADTIATGFADGLKPALYDGPKSSYK